MRKLTRSTTAFVLGKLSLSLLFIVSCIILQADTQLVTSSNRVTIPPKGNQEFFSPNTKAFYFNGPSDVTTQTTKLIIESRIPSTSFAGSTGVLELLVNGTVVQAYVGIRDGASGSLCRLLNKPIVAPVTSSVTAPWFYEVAPPGTAVTNQWRVIYAPDSGGYPSFPSYYNASPYEDCNPYKFEIDITDLVKPDARNEIRLTNFGQNDLEIITLTVSTVSGASSLRSTAGAVTVSQVQYSSSGLDFYVTITPSGGALLKMYTGTFPITAGSHYWLKIDGGTAQDITAAGGGILKTTLPQGTDMHIEIWAQ